MPRLRQSRLLLDASRTATPESRPSTALANSELQPAGIDDKRGSKPGDERKPGAAAEREVHRGGEEGQRGRRDGARRQSLSPRCESEREEEAHDGEDPEPIPVADRARKAITRAIDSKSPSRSGSSRVPSAYVDRSVIAVVTPPSKCGTVERSTRTSAAATMPA